MLTQVTPPHDAKHYFVWLALQQGRDFILDSDTRDVKAAKRLFVALADAKVDYNDEVAIQLYSHIEEMMVKEKAEARELALKAAISFLSGNIEENKQKDDTN